MINRLNMFGNLKYWYSWWLGDLGLLTCKNCGATPLYVRYRDTFLLISIMFIMLLPLFALTLLFFPRLDENTKFYMYAFPILVPGILFFVWMFYWGWIWWKKIATLKLVKGSHAWIICGQIIAQAAGLAVFFGLCYIAFLIFKLL